MSWTCGLECHCHAFFLIIYNYICSMTLTPDLEVIIAFRFQWFILWLQFSKTILAGPNAENNVEPYTRKLKHLLRLEKQKKRDTNHNLILAIS